MAKKRCCKTPRLVWFLDPSTAVRGFTWERWSGANASGVGNPNSDEDGFEMAWAGAAGADGIPTHVNGPPNATGVETDTRFAQSSAQGEQGQDEHRLCYWVHNDGADPIELRDTDTRAESVRVYASCDCPASLVHERYQTGGGTPYNSQGPFMTVPPGGLVKLTVLIHDPGPDFSGFNLRANIVGQTTLSDPVSYQSRPKDDCKIIEDDPCDPYVLLEGESFKPIKLECLDCGSGGEPYVPPEPRILERTCAQLRAAGDAGTLEQGCEYIVTDGVFGTLGPARIHTHATSANEVSWNVAVDTQWDDSSWHGRWDPDTCRIVDLYDNLGNNIKSDNGDEINVFPWGNPLVSGNDFEDFDFNYGGGTVRDNVGTPTARLDTSGDAIVERNVIENGGSYAILSDNAILRDSTVKSAGRVLLSGTASMDDSTVADLSFVRADGLTITRTVFDSYVILYGLGATGDITSSNFSSGQVDLRNAGDIDFDQASTESYGVISANGADRMRLLRVASEDSSTIRAFAGTDLELRYSKAETGSYIYTRQGSMLGQYATAKSGGGIDNNTPGRNTVTRVTSDASRITFEGTADANSVVWSNAHALGYIRLRGTTNGVSVDRVDVSTGARLDYIDAVGGFTRYVTLSDLSYAQIQNTNGARFSASSFHANGRMLWDGGTGQVYSLDLSSIAYVRLINNDGILRYSDFDSYFYYYITGNTGIKQALDGSGRQTFTETNLAGTVTGTPVTNF